VFALFESIGGLELVIVLIAALLVFGKRLPEVASQAGSTISKFKRNLDGAIRESGVENEIRKIKQAIPTDISVSDMARAAAKKMEDRLLEVAEAPAATVAPDAKPSEAALADPTPPAPTEITPTPGVDPAKSFNQPGSVPRE
jgi:sec-independent protein translocase protein TatA